MNQSALIGGALLVGFALFLASRDRLSAYSRVLWGSKPAAHQEAAKSPSDEAAGFDIMDPLGDWGYSLPEIVDDLGGLIGG
jgi:hypothetical protein